MSERDRRALALAHAFGLDLRSPPVPAGAYAPSIRHGNVVYLSGQIPKIGNETVYSGTVGSDISVSQAQEAAKLCALRLLGALISAHGSLDHVDAILRLTVFVQSAPGFDLHSVVADGASALLADVLRCDKGHARTAVGILTLPKNASVEIDMIVALKPDATAVR